MKSSKLVLTCLALVLIVVISEAGNVMKKHSHPSRPTTSQRRGPNAGHQRKPAGAPVRSGSPAGRSPGSRPQSPGVSSIQNSRSPQFQRRKIPKIIITPPDNERPITVTKTTQKKVTFSDPLVNIKYIEPNPIRRRKPSKASARTSG